MPMPSDVLLAMRLALGVIGGKCTVIGAEKLLRVLTALLLGLGVVLALVLSVNCINSVIKRKFFSMVRRAVDRWDLRFGDPFVDDSSLRLRFDGLKSLILFFAFLGVDCIKLSANKCTNS
jgi:hypothetical protein